MEEAITYPNFSVYDVEGGMLKKPYGMSKRVRFDTVSEAVQAARSHSRVKKVPVVVMRYTKPYETDIIFAIDRYGEEIKY